MAIIQHAKHDKNYYRIGPQFASYNSNANTKIRMYAQEDNSF